MEGNLQLLTVTHTNPQLVQINGSTMTFENGNTYNLNDSGLWYFITNTQIEEEIHNENLIHQFLKDMNFNLNYGDKKSTRYYIIKDLVIHYEYHLRSAFN